MFSDLKLSYKLAILVSIPLLCQLVFVTVLWGLSRQAELDAWKADHAREITTEATKIQQLLVRNYELMFAYAHTRKPELHEQLRSSSSRLAADTRSLRMLVGNDPQRIKQTNAICELTADSTNLIDQACTAIENNDLSTLLSLRDKALAKFADLTASVDELVDELRATESTLPQRGEQARDIVKVWLVSGIIGNIVIALLLGWYIQRLTVKRLSAVIDNTRKFARSESLAPPLQGKDEICELDQSFHEMAGSIQQLSAQKKELAAMITHDLRSPLTSIQTSLDLCMLNPHERLPSSAEEYLSVAKDNCGRMLRLINDLLDIEKMEAGKLDLQIEQVPVAYLLETAAETVYGFAKAKGIEIKTSDCDLEANADAERVVQVLVNLLSNAIKFSPKQSIIEVQGAAADDNQVRITVSDCGPGIPDDQADKLFQKFGQIELRGRTRVGSSGLGLVFCKMLVEAHGGAIGFEPGPAGTGTTFYFTLKSGSSL